MTFTIPAWLLWTLGIVIGVPLTIFLLASLYIGVKFMWAIIVDDWKLF